MKRRLLLIMLVLAVMFLAACAPGANTAVVAGSGSPGFWQGLWHGFISLFTFAISLFNDRVGIYEVNNGGSWYDFGFILGVMVFWGGGGRGAAGSRCR